MMSFDYFRGLRDGTFDFDFDANDLRICDLATKWIEEFNKVTVAVLKHHQSFTPINPVINT